MQLNDLTPAPGSRHPRKRVGRGIGSGLGKTAGRGHKGQRSRSGGFHKVGFEGGQMPLQRRLPKRGFVSLTRYDTAEVVLSALEKVQGETIDLKALKDAGIVPHVARQAKVILSGKITRAVKLNGVKVSKGARAAIEAAGGSIVEAEIKQPEADSKKAQRTAQAIEKRAAREKAAKEPRAKEPKAPKKQAKGEAKQADGKEGAKKPPKAPKEGAKDSGKEGAKGKKG